MYHLQQQQEEEDQDQEKQCTSEVAVHHPQQPSRFRLVAFLTARGMLPTACPKQHRERLYAPSPALFSTPPR